MRLSTVARVATRVLYGAAIAAILLAAGAPVAAQTEKTPRPADLTPEVRARIDGIANALPVEKLSHQQLDIQGNTTGFCLRRP
jgi:hypothetical protein